MALPAVAEGLDTAGNAQIVGLLAIAAVARGDVAADQDTQAACGQEVLECSEINVCGCESLRFGCFRGSFDGIRRNRPGAHFNSRQFP